MSTVLNLFNNTPKLFRERLLEERTQRLGQGSTCLSFGFPYLDNLTGGIYKNDLIVLGAKTGIGKTQLAMLIAMNNALAGKRVHFFALEAEPNEVEKRIKFLILSDMFHKILKGKFPGLFLNFQDWAYGKIDQLREYETEIDAEMSNLFPHLWTFYRTGAGDFTAEDLQRHLLAIQDQTDLVIVDHLHYVDLDGENENRAMKATVKKIRDMALLIGKPVVLVAHMRKSDRRLKQVVPGADEFHGSSDIAKIATKIITLAPCHDFRETGNAWPTYVRVVKNRFDMSRTRFVGLCGFNANTNTYERDYFLGRLSPAEDEFESIRSYADIPVWAKSAKIMKGEP